jgi:adenylate cyclase, class 2
MKDQEMKDQELEVKFFVTDLSTVETRLQNLGAHLTSPRILEVNLRFDTPDNQLGRGMRVLRLRQDAISRLTYKGPASGLGGARLRQELEFEVSDFAVARAFLEALGYQVMMIYEKYRAAYDLDTVEVSLDELPYGTFVEIEGPDPAAIQAVTRQLGLDWEATIPASYTVLFDQLKTRLSLPFRDLSFENFKDLLVTPADLGVRPADA